MTEPRSATYIPAIVQQALDLADERDFPSCCSAPVGRLLHVMAGQYDQGVIAEIGTGYGVGASWIASALSPSTTFVSVDIDPERSASVAAMLKPFPNVRIVNGDWHSILSYGPFTMVFADCAAAKRDEPGLLVESLRPGGLIVLDDLTDPIREYWLNEPRMCATEILADPMIPVILATRVR